MRRRLLLHRRRAIPCAARHRAAAEVAAAARSSSGDAEAMVFAGAFSQPRCATATGSPPSDDRFHSAHAQAVYIEARSKYHVQCMEWNNKVAALMDSMSRFRFSIAIWSAFLMAIPGEVHDRDGVPRVLLREAMRGVLPDSIRARTWKSDFTHSSTSACVMTRRDSRTLSADCLGVRFGYLDATRLASGAGAASRTSGARMHGQLGSGRYIWPEMWLQVFWGPPRECLMTRKIDPRASVKRPIARRS